VNSFSLFFLLFLWPSIACKFNVHDKCKKKVTVECGTHRKLDKDEVSRVNGHEFTGKTYSSPTWCDNCNNFIWGFSHQGWKCSSKSKTLLPLPLLLLLPLPLSLPHVLPWP